MRTFMLPIVLSCLAMSVCGAENANKQHVLRGVEAENFIAALIYGNSELFDTVYESQQTQVRFTITDLDISSRAGTMGYGPDDTLFALPSAMASGHISGHDATAEFSDGMRLYEIADKFHIEPDAGMGRIEYFFTKVDCQIDRTFESVDNRFSCSYSLQGD